MFVFSSLSEFDTMPKLILKAVSSSKSAASAAVDQVVGQVDTASGAQRLSISAQANTQYRLVDSKTGQVIKNQTVVRKGKTLQIRLRATRSTSANC
jgi:hypothetical protein